MKDIDFDELDKAVNSLMATTTEPAPQPAADAPQPVTVTPPPAIVNAPSVPPAATTSVPAVESTPVVAPPAVSRPTVPATRRSGRFMDMVSKPAEQKLRPTPSREGIALTPRSETRVSAATAPQIDQPVAVSTPTPVATTDVMPDPIDMQPVVETPEQTSEPVVTPAPSLGSLDSPFLSDAKVEKRPLNAGSDDSVMAAEVPEAVSPIESLVAAETPDEQSAAQDDQKGADEPPAMPQVAELDSDLVAIESSESSDATQAVETADAATQVSVPSVPLGAASIPQQYTPQPSTGDQSHAAIYDASQYPEPVAHPAKSKSGWLWVLWVILLLGIGAGGAILLYNLGIIP